MSIPIIKNKIHENYIAIIRKLIDNECIFAYIR